LETRLVQLDEQIEYWSAKYETDMEFNTTKVKDTKEEIQNLSTENAEMVVLIAKREKEMEKFLVIKAKREAEEAAEKKINDSATAIQAWWRGVMVRRKLGPYRKKKKKKAGKPGAKPMKK
jgi:IQ domain-containing protein G